jgi:phosphoenolpyruvate carboxylase
MHCCMTNHTVARPRTFVQVTTFGMGLVTLDCRQESSKHTEAIDTITTYLGLGSYKEWDEEKRTSFLLSELTGKRPLLPPGERQSAVSPRFSCCACC